MMRKCLSLLCIACMQVILTAQTVTATNFGSICGTIKDKTDNSTIPYAAIKLSEMASKKNFAATSDINGSYCFSNLTPGKYNLEISYVGYTTFKLNNISLTPSQKLKLNHLLDNATLKLSEVVVKEDKNCEGKRIKATNSVASSCVISYNATTKSLSAPTYYTQPAADYNTEEYHSITDNDFKEATKNPLSTMSIDVDRAAYSNVRRFITQGGLPPADAVRIEEMVNYFHYEYPQPKSNEPFSINTEYTECAWNKKHQLIHIGIQGKEIATDNLPANNLVFLIDVSGSMMGADKLPLLKSGLQLLIDQLRPQDHVSIVVYAGAAGVVLPSTSGSNKEKISAALEQLQAGGSTAGGEGIVLAYKTAQEHFIKSGNNRVILATDGDFNVGVSSDGELVRLIEKEREKDIFLTVLGFGTGNYKDSKMEQLADKGNGNYAYIDNLLEAKKVLVKEMGGTLLTIAKDVKIQIEFNPAKVKAYRLVGYENRLLNNEDFNDDKKDAGELGSGHTVTALYEIIPADSDETLNNIDPLKYQKTEPIIAYTGSTEVMTIKFRYKEPKENESKLITKVIGDIRTNLSTASENCQFASAVAGFGLLLRDSKYKGNINYASIISLAKAAKGKDDDGYRAEFIRLVETAQLMKQKNG